MREPVDFIRLQALGRDRLASVISEALSREPGNMLARPLLHDDDWRLVVEALRRATMAASLPETGSENTGGRS